MLGDSEVTRDLEEVTNPRDVVLPTIGLTEKES